MKEIKIPIYHTDSNKIARYDTLDSVASNICDTYGMVKQFEIDIAKSSQFVLRYALECGELLYRVKEALEHGKFNPWFDKHIKKAMSKQTACNYMRLWKHKDAVKDCESIRKAYIKIGAIVVKENVDTFIEEVPTMSGNGVNTPATPIIPPAGLAGVFSPYATSKGWLHGLPPSVLKKKMKGGGCIGELLNNTHNPANKSILLQQFEEQYKSEIAAEQAKMSQAPQGNGNKVSHRGKPAKPADTEDKLHTPLSEEEEAKRLSQSTALKVIAEAMVWSLIHLDQHDAIATALAIDSIQPIAVWYKEHAPATKRTSKKSSGNRLAKANKSKVSVDIGARKETAHAE